MSLQLGNLPPAFLPIGDKRLFELQAGSSDHSKIIMSLPLDYSIGLQDQKRIAACNIEVVRLPPGLSLSDAISKILGQLPTSTASIEILFGDTIVDVDAAGQSNVVSYSSTSVDYPWSFVNADGHNATLFSEALGSSIKNKIVCGHFKISDGEMLRGLMKKLPFIEAFNAYSDKVGLKAVEVSNWYDFGHLATYYQSKRKIMISRHFNSLKSDGETVRKTSTQTQKMRAEIAWYEALPRRIKLHTPKYIGSFFEDHQVGYELEYLFKPTLSDLFVFGELSTQASFLILRQCLVLMEQFREIKPDLQSPEASKAFADNFYDDMFVGKTRERFDKFCHDRQISKDTVFTINGQEMPPLSMLLDDVFSNIPKTRTEDISFWHGDFFFGNSFFDMESRRVLLVDPRGMLPDGTLSQFGDWRYDLGKLAHSILGRYDHVIFNQSSLDQQSDTQWILETSKSDTTITTENLFLQEVKSRFGLPEKQVFALTASMFFSMLPLHEDSPARQNKLLACGLLLHSRMKMSNP